MTTQKTHSKHMKSHHLRRCRICRERYPLFEGGVEGYEIDSHGKQIGKLNPVWNFKNTTGGYMCKKCTATKEPQA